MAWYRGQKKETTDDYIRFDVRMMRRKGCLRPGFSANWEWKRSGERFAWIQFESQNDQIRLRCRNRSRGEEWQRLSGWRGMAALPLRRHAAMVPLSKLPIAERQSSTARSISFAVAVSISPMSHSGSAPYFRARSKAQAICWHDH